MLELAANDHNVVPGWWTVAEEAEDTEATDLKPPWRTLARNEAFLGEFPLISSKESGLMNISMMIESCTLPVAALLYLAWKVRSRDGNTGTVRCLCAFVLVVGTILASLQVLSMILRTDIPPAEYLHFILDGCARLLPLAGWLLGVLLVKNFKPDDPHSEPPLGLTPAENKGQDVTVSP